MNAKRLIQVLAGCCWVVGVCAHAEDSAPLRLAQTIQLSDVSGRIDHMAVDTAGQRLFVAALDNGSVEVVDLKAARPVHTISRLREPQGVAFIPLLNQIYVCSGGDGTCRVFNGESYRQIRSLDFKPEPNPDNIRYDTSARQILIGFGGEPVFIKTMEGQLANVAPGGFMCVINLADPEHVDQFSLASGHPESFQLETKGDRVFVNIPTFRKVIVVKRGSKTVIASWPINEAAGNYPMALDETNHRLFVGCRDPATLLVLDTTSGKEMARLAIDGDADDVFYDANRKVLYVSCGSGFIDVVAQNDADHYKVTEKIPTAKGGRTSLLVPELNRFYVAFPKQGEQPAEIRVYDLQSQSR